MTSGSDITMHMITSVDSTISKSTLPANYSSAHAIELLQKQKFQDKIKKCFSDA